MAKEYIEREAAIDIAMQYCPDDDGVCSKADADLREMLDEIEAIPTADVVEVVRCKDCKFIDDGKCLWWDYIPPRDDWFCADGEAALKEG